MKLLSSPASPYTRKVRIVLAEKKIECQPVEMTPWTPDSEVPSINPLGKIPVLIDSGFRRGSDASAWSEPTS